MSLASNTRFLSAWLNNPLQTGAVLPSGQALARALAAQVDPAAAGVVELGAGTGAVTAALLERGVAPERLLLVERSPLLHAEIQRRFAGLRAVLGDAARLRRLLQQAGFGPPDAVVSSLPLLSMPPRTRLRVLSEIAAMLPPGGTLVQFTYGPRPPLAPALAQGLGLAGERVARVLANVPPAAVWVYRKRG